MDKVFDIIEKERIRQEEEICLIASENYVSQDIMKAVGSILTNKYAEGYPSHRYYGGCKFIDELEQYAIDKCKELFKCQYANVQPHSGSQTNQAVYLALLKPNDTILGMSLDAGGHLTHGSKVSSSGKIYNSISYGLDENGILNYEEIKEKLYQYNPKLLVVGASAYSRMIDFKRIREILDEYNKNNDRCYMLVDMAHIAGLVATGLHPSPIPYADVVTSTTHKTLRGTRGGIIVSNDVELGKKIDKAVFPGIQGGPLEHIIAGKAICFEEALEPSFKEYQEQVLRNIQAMVDVFKAREINMVSNGSDNHLILLDLRSKGISGKQLEDKLSELGIVVNKNAIKDDPLPKTETSGVRIGTAAITTRRMKEKEAAWIAHQICNTIERLSGEYDFDGIGLIKATYDTKFGRDLSYDEAEDEMTKDNVKLLCKKFPIYK